MNSLNLLNRGQGHDIVSTMTGTNSILLLSNIYLYILTLYSILIFAAIRK